MEQKLEKKKAINSFIQAYVICIPLFNFFLGTIIGDGTMLINIGVCLFLFVLNNRGIDSFRIDKRLFFYLFLISAWYMISIFRGVSSLSPMEFIYYFLFASLVSVQAFHYEKVVTYVVLISYLVIPFGKIIFFDETTGYYSNSSVSLSLSYALLPLIVAGMIHFFYYRNTAKWYVKLCYMIDLFLIAQLFIKGNRGLVFSLFFAIIMILMKGKKNHRKKITAAQVLLTVLIMAIILINLDLILQAIGIALEKVGLSANFLEKMVQLKEKDNIMNGRDFIYSFVFRNAISSPIWGHGISSIRSFSGGRILYPHNFLLQLFFDGGLLLWFTFVAILVKQIKKMFINGTEADESIYLLFLFLCTVPKMLFSTDMWTNAAFFMMISYVIVDRSSIYTRNITAGSQR